MRTSPAMNLSHCQRKLCLVGWQGAAPVGELGGDLLPLRFGGHVGGDVHRLVGIRADVDLDDAIRIVVDLKVHCGPQRFRV